ncbi:MAG: tetratricopeptide repeat protein [Syntrophobacteraceae bacterium]
MIDVFRPVDRTGAGALNNEGIALYAKRRYDKAIADYSRTVSLDPWNAEGYNSLGYIMATCPDPRYRNGIKAEEYAKKAGKLTGWKAAYVLDTLAAAYAQAGDFEAAAKWLQRAIDLASSAQKVEFERRLDLYKSGKPYRYDTGK